MFKPLEYVGLVLNLLSFCTNCFLIIFNVLKLVLITPPAKIQMLLKILNDNTTTVLFNFCYLFKTPPKTSNPPNFKELVFHFVITIINLDFCLCVRETFGDATL